VLSKRKKCSITFLYFHLQGNHDKDIARIVDMGFSVEQATKALRESKGGFDGAINSLLGETGGPPPSDFTAPRGDSASRGGRHDSRPSRGGMDSGRSQEVRFGGRTRVDSDGHPHDNAGRDSEGRGGGRDGREDGSRNDGGRSRGDGRPRRGGRKDDEDDEYGSHSRPSAPATLFDFVTSKIPSASVSGKDFRRIIGPWILVISLGVNRQDHYSICVNFLVYNVFYNYA